MQHTTSAWTVVEFGSVFRPGGRWPPRNNQFFSMAFLRDLAALSWVLPHRTPQQLGMLSER